MAGDKLYGHNFRLVREFGYKFFDILLIRVFPAIIHCSESAKLFILSMVFDRPGDFKPYNIAFPRKHRIFALDNINNADNASDKSGEIGEPSVQNRRIGFVFGESPDVHDNNDHFHFGDRDLGSDARFRGSQTQGHDPVRRGQQLQRDLHGHFPRDDLFRGGHSGHRGLWRCHTLFLIGTDLRHHLYSGRLGAAAQTDQRTHQTHGHAESLRPRPIQGQRRSPPYNHLRKCQGPCLEKLLQRVVPSRPRQPRQKRHHFAAAGAQSGNGDISAQPPIRTLPHLPPGQPYARTRPQKVPGHQKQSLRDFDQQI